METKRLISSYDEINDTFVGKIDGKIRYCADYNISDGIYLALDSSKIPCSVFVDGASEVFNISKDILEKSDVRISISCNSMHISLIMFIEGLKVCSIKCENRCGIPEMDCLMDTNY